MAERPALALVVPCYNEEDRLRTDLFGEWLSRNPDIQVIFVDDGSSDQTLRVLERLRSESGVPVSVVALAKNGGKAEAVRSGVLYALDRMQPQMVGFWDADLATPLESVRSFLSLLAARPEIEMIFGSRVQLLGRNVVRKPYRHYLGRIFATAVSIVLQLPIYDTQCGAKIFRVTDRTRRMFSDPFLSKWVFDVEIIARYVRSLECSRQALEQLIYEYPLENWQDVGDSKVQAKDFFIAFWDILRIHSRYLT